MTDARFSRIAGISAIVGVVMLFGATMLHPMEASPSDAPAAFAEYAQDHYWVASHLGQLVGMLLISNGLIALSWKLREGRSAPWALFAGFATIASVVLAAALQAIDGVALKFVVDRWAGAVESARPVTFEAAYAVRQVEIGLASVLEMFFGLSVLLYGAALVLSAVGRTWLGLFGAVAGAAMVISGVTKAHVGFSEVGMATSMATSLTVLTWAICVGLFLLQRRRTTAAGT